MNFIPMTPYKRGLRNAPTKQKKTAHLHLDREQLYPHTQLGNHISCRRRKYTITELMREREEKKRKEIRAVLPEQIIQRTADALCQEETPFTRVLYGGLMKKPQGESQVIKFNTRLNDSKTEVVPPPRPYAPHPAKAICIYHRYTKKRSDLSI